jgi:predicted dehydrogenase
MGAMYARAIEQHPKASLVAAVDLDKSRRDGLAELYPKVHLFESSALMLAEGTIDAAVVALPDFAHRDAAVACLNQGVHVLCEKPLAMTMEDARAIVDAAEASVGKLMVNFGNRHRPSFHLLRGEVASGRLGEIHSVLVKGHERVDKTLSLAWRDRTNPTWFLISHVVDLVGWLFSSRFQTVYGLGSDRRPEALTKVTGPNSVWYLGSLENGANVVMGSTWALPNGYPRRGDFAFEVIGTHGAIALDANEGGLRYFYEQAADIGWDFDLPNYAGVRTDWWHTSVSYFLDCVQRGVQPEPSGPDALETVTVLTAMTESLRTGQVVKVEDVRRVAIA